MPVRGFAKGARAIRGGAGERAFHMSKKLALQEIRGDRCAIDRDERLALAHAMFVQGARHQFFAGSSLAQDQHRRIAVGRKADRLLHTPHRLAQTNEATRLACRRCRLGKAPRRQLVQKSAELLTPDRLGQMIERAKPHRLDGVLSRRKSRQHNDRRSILLRADAAKHLHAVHAARHAQIEQNAIEVTTSKYRKSLAAGSGGMRLVAEIADGLRKTFAHGGVVIDD